MATVITAGNATNGLSFTADNTGALEFKTGTGAGTTAMTISSAQATTFAAGVSGTTGSFSGNMSFNSGYGSAAVAYGCRAWVNFNGTGTVAIRASGNVTSITDNGVGDYTVNFTNAMPDINYSATGFAWASNKNACAIFLGPKVTATNPETTTTIRITTRDNISETILYDPDVVNVSVFR